MATDKKESGAETAGSSRLNSLVSPEEFSRRRDRFYAETKQIRQEILKLTELQTPSFIVFDDGEIQTVHSVDYNVAMEQLQHLMRRSYEEIVLNGANALESD